MFCKTNRIEMLIIYIYGTKKKKKRKERYRVKQLKEIKNLKLNSICSRVWPSNGSSSSSIKFKRFYDEKRKSSIGEFMDINPLVFTLIMYLHIIKRKD